MKRPSSGPRSAPSSAANRPPAARLRRRRAGLLGAGVVAVATLGGIAYGTGTSTPAAAAGAAVTPKTEAPNEARAMSRAFSAVAKALGPSVVRIEVEVGAPKVADRRGRRGQPAPDDEGDDGNIPPFFRHF